MQPQQYIQAALRTEHTPPFITTRHGVEHDVVLSRVMHAMLGLVSEIGELADAIKKHLIYDKQLDLVNLVEESGDLDWYRALLADALGVGFEAAWEKNIAKLRARYPDRFTSERALTRDLDAERAALEGIEGNPRG